MGDEETNLQLSESRADSVKTYLVDAGIAEDRIETEGRGQTEPRDTNDTDEGRANNRRIEFEILVRRPDEDEADAAEAADVKPAQDESTPAADAP